MQLLLGVIVEYYNALASRQLNWDSIHNAFTTRTQMEVSKNALLKAFKKIPASTMEAARNFVAEALTGRAEVVEPSADVSTPRSGPRKFY